MCAGATGKVLIVTPTDIHDAIEFWKILGMVAGGVAAGHVIWWAPWAKRKIISGVKWAFSNVRPRLEFIEND